MAFQLSPGVLTREQDASNVVPAVGTTVGGFAGNFRWGPARKLTSISSENQLVERFGKPASDKNVDFLTAASFLAYGSSLLVSREVGAAARNAVSSGTAVLIRNDDEYDASYEDGSGTVGPFAAKYAGTLGNSLEVSVADLGNFTGTSVASISVTAAGSGYTSAPTVTIAAPDTGSSNATATAALDGSTVDTVTVTFPGAGYSTAPSVTFSGGGGSGATATATLSTAWSYASNFDYTPSTTTWASDNSISIDELHLIVVDEDGAITGKAGTVLEKFAGLSKAPGAKNDNNESNYYKDVINTQSKWIRWMDPVSTTSTTLGEAWGTAVATVQAATNKSYKPIIDGVDTDAFSLTGGVDADPVDADLQNSYILFANDEETDVSLIIAGAASKTVGDYIIDNVTDIRKDCLVFLSPQKASVVNNSGSEVTDIKAELSSYTRSSYATIDSGWKYMYDKYNDKYVWVPCNADTAGACVTADLEADPWFSPAGVNRGQIKNAVKLAFNPKKSDRDTLYAAGVNPIVQSAQQGIILFGDKTLLEKASAFNRINVRRLFIVVEKAIATAAKFQLFEFNDAFTRSQFRSLVEPFLRDVQGRRGIYDFRVVCDETNNTADVIDRNEFVADIFIKPAKSINFITLTFVATRTGISFEELGA